MNTSLLAMPACCQDEHFESEELALRSSRHGWSGN
jgi:hypothetical protein